MAKSDFNIAEILGAQLSNVPGSCASATPRTIENITVEIREMKKTAGDAIIGIGQRLIEAKALLSHGEWLPWLTEQVEFSERTATRFMRLAREWSNQTALSDLGATKALTLLALPTDEREIFMSENHIVAGEEKTVIDMSARELEQAIRERDEARKAAETAKADADVAEQRRAKMEADMATLKQMRDASEVDVHSREAELQQLREELQAMRDKPVDVAVMAVDQEALNKARADAVAEMQAKLDKAVEARKKAEDKRKAAEDALASAKETATAEVQEKLRSTERELQATQAQLVDAVKAEKRAVITGDSDLAVFKAYFDQAQEVVNKMLGLLLKTDQREDKDQSAKMRKVLSALSDAIRKGAE